jgi:hypothetical protein
VKNFALDLSGSKWGPVVGSCERSIRCGEFLDQLSCPELLKKDFAPWRTVNGCDYLVQVIPRVLYTKCRKLKLIGGEVLLVQPYP